MHNKSTPIIDMEMPSNIINKATREIAREYMNLGKAIVETQTTSLEEGVELAKTLISKMPDDIITASHKLQVLAKAGYDLRGLIETPEKVNYLYTLTSYKLKGGENMSKEIRFQLGDKVRFKEGCTNVVREILEIDKQDSQLPYLVLTRASHYTHHSTDWVSDSQLERIPFKIADLFQVYQNPDNQNRRFKTSFGVEIYFDGENINAIGESDRYPDDITDLYTSFDMMDIEVIEQFPKEMTIEEIEDELGYKVKIVGE